MPQRCALILPPPSWTLQDCRAHQPIDNQADLLRGTHPSPKTNYTNQTNSFSASSCSSFSTCFLHAVLHCVVLRILLHLAYATQTYIRQDRVILNTAQLQHHTTFISISFSLYILFLQANTQSVSASTMYAIQSNANSCVPSASFACSGSPPRCCKHLPSTITGGTCVEG